MLLDNQPEFYDIVWAAMRIGVYVTPINWHLVATEAGYIVRRLRRHGVVRRARRSPTWSRRWATTSPNVTTRICVDGDIPGFERMTDLVIAASTAAPLDNEREGGWMFYSSGTTGQPKGILPPLPPGDLGAPSFLTGMLKGLFGFNSDTVYLSPARRCTTPRRRVGPTARNASAAPRS